MELYDLIDSEDFNIIQGTTTTICALKLHSGFVVIGKSACLNPADFDEDVGRKIAFEDAFNQLWQLEGYHRAAEANK
jgi:hypothetical protein